MANEIIVNAHWMEKRIAVIEDNKLVELLVEKKQQENIVGNIYKGRVRDVLPGMGAAFIDLGLERTGFLHYSDIMTDFLDTVDSDKHKLSHIDKDSSKIGKFIKSGEEIIVQIQKGPIDKKGARLTGQISIPGKYLVLFPNKNRIAISRKMANPKERDRLREILKGIKKENFGLIVRTAAEGATEEELAAQYKALENTWRLVEKQINHAKAPACIFDENDIINVLIRDLFSEKIDRVVVDNLIVAAEIRQRISITSPDLADRIEVYQEDSPIFDAYGLEKEIIKIFQSRISLPSGGNIKIELTEALVSIDINTGSFTGNRNYDQTVRLTNVEAAGEIGRQIRLRDLSGIMVIDFIDMKNERHKQEVLETLRRTLKSDRAKNKVFSFSPLGLVEVTRKRMRTNLLVTYSENCPHCNGTGRILSRESVALRIYRWLQRADYFIKGHALEIYVHPAVKEYLQEQPGFFKVVPNTLMLMDDETLSQAEFRVIDMKTRQDLTGKYNA